VSRRSSFRSRTRSRAKKDVRPGPPRLSLHPFSGLNPDTLIEALKNLGRRSADDFPALVESLDRGFREVHPLSALAILAAWGTYATVSRDGASTEGMLGRIGQHHIELMQALILRVPPADWGNKLPVPASTQKAIDDIESVTEAFHQRRYQDLENAKDRQEKTVRALQERLRMHTQIVRNWGYPADVKRIARDLASPLDEKLRARHGFSFGELVTVAEALVTLHEDRLNKRFAALKRVFAQKSARQVVRIYYREFPGVGTDHEAFFSDISSSATTQDVKSMVLAHANLTLIDLMTISSAEVATAAAVDAELAGNILRRLSLEPGALAEKEPEHLFLANPVWERPGIMLDKDLFVFPVAATVFSFITKILRDLCDTGELKDALELRRAAYLEDEIGAIAERCLGGAAAIHRNVKWNWEGREYETDVIAVVDRALILFEAKSATLTAAGLRGAPNSVKNHVKDLIVAPAEQSARLAALVRRAATGDASALAATAGLPFDPREIDDVARVSITLDDISVIASAEDELREAGWVPEGLELAPTMNLADLCVMVDILDSPLLMVDYLIERERLQKALAVFGDELDFLALYLSTGFNFASFEDEVHSLAISGMSEPIDKYYMSLHVGVQLKKPTLRLSPYFEKIIKAVETRRSPGWTTLGRALLHVGSPEEQKRIQNGMEKLRRTVPKEFRRAGHHNAIVIRPPAPRDTLGLFHIHHPRNGRDFRADVQQLAAEAMEEQGMSRCVAIVRSTDQWDAPYRFLALVRRDAAVDEAKEDRQL